MALDKNEAIALAIEIHEVKKFLPAKDYDWQADVIKLVESDVFTTRQAALIAGRNPQYAQKAVKDYFKDTLTPGYKPRAFGGVSGKFNPESLQKIQYVRNRWATMHRPGHRTDDVTRRYILELIDEGNGISLIAHLTDISRNTIEMIRKTEARRG